MSTYHKYNDEQSANNNAVLAVFAIVLAALVIIGFLMSQAASQPLPSSIENRQAMPGPGS